jgi:hypothetical protein
MSVISMQVPSAVKIEVDYEQISLTDSCLDEELQEPSKSITQKDVLKHVKLRVAQELRLLQMQWSMLLLCFTVIVYGSMMVFRNLAFYRFRAGPRLTQDLGFDWLPEFQTKFTGTPILILQIVLSIACIMSFVPRINLSCAAFVVNIWRRWAVMIAMGNCLRFLTNISTTLPGSANHCLPSNPNIAKDQPTTLNNILFRIALDGVGRDGTSGSYNCGDLTFSGHILMTMTYAFCCLRYVPNCCMLSHAINTLLERFIWAIVSMQCILTIMARNHYTMDVVIALYVTPLLWHFYIVTLEHDHTITLYNHTMFVWVNFFHTNKILFTP